MSLPPMTTPSTGSSSSLKPGRSSSGTRKLMPSSPPVRLDSCEARIAKNEATASVIIAKKIAFTRSENRPIRNDSASDARMASDAPSAIEAQLGSRRAIAMPMP